MNPLNRVILSGVALLALSSCNDVLGDIYDQPEETSDYGFVRVCTATSPGLIYIDATDYQVWTYIDFSTRSTQALPVTAPAPARWDFAVHRYDTKTNGALVFTTDLTDIEDARRWDNPGNEEGVADVWTTDKIVTDMSTMMQGYLTYADSYYNPALSSWLTVDTSVMPPIYSASGKVYILSFDDGSRAAVKLAGYTSADGVKGYMSIQYIYPL